MIHLPISLQAWDTPAFPAALRQELEDLGGDALPLQQGLSLSSAVADGRVEVMFIGAREDARFIHARVGIFYAGIVAGCNCADDPTPVEPQHEYCELQLVIDRASAETTVTLVADAQA